jgi:hypothetical protein
MYDREVGWGGRHRLDQSGSEYGQVRGWCKCGNESLSSIKCFSGTTLFHGVSKSICLFVYLFIYLHN